MSGIEVKRTNMGNKPLKAINGDEMSASFQNFLAIFFFIALAAYSKRKGRTGNQN